MAKYLRDFPNGPLDRYRKKASFDRKKMMVHLESEEIIEFQHNIYEEIRKHPALFDDPAKTPTLDEQRRIATNRCRIISNIGSFSVTNQLDNLRKPLAAITVLFQIDPSLSIKYYIDAGMFPSVLRNLGTDRHLQDLSESLQGNIIGSYCLTEIGHGSNAKCMQTVATYDNKTKEFVLHSPNFQAAKCWAGVLGQTATHGIVYAQLITSDGVNQGLHPFCVKIRDPKTLLPYPGVIVGDMGEKINLNGLDNGFVLFKNYRISRTDLLNRTGDVSEDGRYVTPYKDPNKRYGASLGALSMGRIVITGICSIYCSTAITIAVRYAAVRLQFGPDDSEEIPVLEYQSHQHRLIPYLSVAYILKIFGIYLMHTQYQFTIDTMTGGNNNKLADLGLELHAISSASKSVAGWVVRDAIQECREACGGHGYLKVAGIGDLRNCHDVNCTYEGENHVLIQQTSNWLLKLWPLILQGKTVSSPLQSIDFLTNAKKILTSKFRNCSINQFIEPNNIMNIYQWMVCYLLKVSYEKCEKLMKTDKLDSFTAKNESQVYFCKTLAIAYCEQFMLQRMLATISETADKQLKSVLLRLFQLYGVWTLSKHALTLYQGGFASGPDMATILQQSVLKLCKDLKDDAVSLVDAIAPPDFLMKSALGRSDGLVYKHLEDAILGAPGALSRPAWWEEILRGKNKVTSKL